MAPAAKIKNLIQVKQALADKYARRAETAGSKPLQAKLWRKSVRYSRQALALSRQASNG